MPSFLDRLKSGADKAAFEADRLVRLNQAQAAVRSAQRDLETEVGVLGREALALYDAGSLSQPELLETCRRIDGVRLQIAELESNVERIRQEKAPDPSGAAQPEAAAAPEPVAPEAGEAPVDPAPPRAPTPSPQGQTCPGCGSPLRPGVRFCPECGTRLEDVQPG